MANVGRFRIPIEAGQRDVIRAMVKAPMRQPAVTFELRDGQGKTMYKTPLALTVLNDMTDFKHNSQLMMNTDRVKDRERFYPVEAVFVAPAESKEMWISFMYSWASGKAYFDDVELFKLPPPGE